MLKVIGIISSIGIIASTVITAFAVGYAADLFDQSLHGLD